MAQPPNTFIATPGRILRLEPMELSRELSARLRSIDPDLALVQASVGTFDLEANMNRTGVQHVWRLIRRWPATDPRRAMIRSGQYPEENAFDWYGDLPRDVETHEIPAYLERTLRSMGAPRPIVDGVAQWNLDQSLRNGTANTEEYVDLIHRAAPAREDQRRPRAAEAGR